MRTITLLDGGMGKELRRIGAPFRQPEWSALALMEDPASVVRAHRNFIAAGAEVVITNNYAVVPFHLGDDRFATDGRNLLDLAGRLARRAADDSGRDVVVAGSLPPLWGSYEPDRFDPEVAPAIYELIVDSLAPYVDVWIAETLSRVDELDCIVGVLAGRAPILGATPLWASFCLPDRQVGDEPALRSGESLDDIVDLAVDHSPPIEAILFNCSLPEQTTPALGHLSTALGRAGLDVRIGGYANAFPADRDDGYSANATIFERRDDLTAERYAAFVDEWIDIGATIVGGCCDIYPEHIAALSSRLGRVRPAR